ncbi:MAG: hypothetical protein ACP5FT_00380 [Acidilobus sp.]
MSEDTPTLREFLAKYGDRGKYVIKAILEASLSGGRAKLGDFDLKGLKERLKSMGLDYNPVPLLYILERTYGVIRTTYRSANQHWWVITDRRALQEALQELGDESSLEDYDLRLLRIQFYSLEPERIIAQLRSNSRSRQLIAKLAFTTLPLLIDFLKRAREQYPDELAKEIEMAEQILELAERAIMKPNTGARSKIDLVAEAEVYDNSLAGGPGEPV